MTDREKLLKRAQQIWDDGHERIAGKAMDASYMAERAHVEAIADALETLTTDAEQVKEAAAKIARDYASKARNRGWPTAPDSAAKAADHIAAAISAMPLPTSTDKERVLREVADAADDMIRALNEHLMTPKRYNEAGKRLQAARDRIDAALSTTGAKP